MQDGFLNFSAILGCGVYALSHRGRVVYIGKAKCGLSRIASHRANRGKKLPSWMPATLRGVLFDEVHFLPSHPDRVDALERDMIAKYRPRMNIHSKPAQPVPMALTIVYNGITHTVAPEPPLSRRALA